MVRDLDRLAGSTFDLLVVGGGIYGLAIAYDAAQRGASVALVERDDFGCGSSFNHLRTIHGGLRYLQHLDVARARESVRERRTFARVAPESVRPMQFVLPLGRSLTRGRLAMRAGFLLDRIVGAGRNRGVPPTHRLRPGRVLSRTRAIAEFPGLFRRGLTGAAVWEDYVTVEADRLTFSVALAGARQGAVLANHVEARAVRMEGRRATGIAARDRLTGRDLGVSARLTVLAAGAAIGPLAAPLGIAANTPLVRAMNLVTRRAAAGAAIGGRSASGRNLFLVPWRGRALFGTWESPAACEPGAPPATREDVAAFVAELNEAFPGLDLALDDVTLVHQGLVPATVNGDGRVAPRGREEIRDHARDGVEGLVSIAGTKYTTARAVAGRVVDAALAKLGRPARACRTADVPLPGGGIGDVSLAVAQSRREHDADVPSDTIPHLVGAYGSLASEVLELAVQRPHWRDRIAEESPVIGAELVWAARNEMALTLADAVIRRTPLGALGCPTDDALARAAGIVGGELGWTPDRARDEIAGVRAFYGTWNALKT